MSGPQRIVCLTEETTETLYLLGQEDRIVGISAYTRRPARAAREKPVVCQFIKADLDAIQAIEPDLVLAFSDLQADICGELIRAGLEVHCFNQRNLAGILDMVRRLGALVDCRDEAEALARRMEDMLARARSRSQGMTRRPRVFFEEWPDPIISGICWVSELIELAGGEDIFADLRHRGQAKDRIVEAGEVLARSPEFYLACWCGRPFKRDVVLKRTGFEGAPFTAAGRMVELPAEIMLQPGPACIFEGLPLLQELFEGI